MSRSRASSPFTKPLAPRAASAELSTNGIHSTTELRTLLSTSLNDTGAIDDLPAIPTALGMRS